MNGREAEGNKTPAHKSLMFKIPNLATKNSDIKPSEENKSIASVKV